MDLLTTSHDLVAGAAALIVVATVVWLILRRRRTLLDQIDRLEAEIEALHDSIWELSESREHYRSIVEAQGDLIEPPPFPGYTSAPVREGWLRTSAVGVNHGFGRHGQLSARISHSQGISRGTGFDLSFSRRQTLFGSDANWRASVFDRPGSISSGLRRNRGVEFTLNIALGQDGRRYSGSLGSRTGARGGRDVYASAGVQQSFADSIVHSIAGQATVDSTGIGLGGNAHFESAALRGDLHLQRSSLDGGVSGGVNLESTLAVGGGSLAIAGDGQASMVDTGMIIDVRSDLAGATIRAHDSRGGSHILRPGRNLLPVSAYRPGSIQLDFDDHHAPAAAIQPTRPTGVSRLHPLSSTAAARIASPSSMPRPRRPESEVRFALS